MKISRQFQSGCFQLPVAIRRMQNLTNPRQHSMTLAFRVKAGFIVDTIFVCSFVRHCLSDGLVVSMLETARVKTNLLYTLPIKKIIM